MWTRIRFGQAPWRRSIARCPRCALARASPGTEADDRTQARKPGDRPVCLAAFVEFWEHEGSAHFIKEETDLPANTRVADPDHPAVVRTLLEHVLIRAKSAKIREQPEPEPADLNAPGIWLELHVRHEEISWAS